MPRRLDASEGGGHQDPPSLPLVIPLTTPFPLVLPPLFPLLPPSPFISRCCTRCDINTMNSGTRRVKTMAEDLDGGGRGKGTRNIFPKHLPSDVRHAGRGQPEPFRPRDVAGQRERGRKVGRRTDIVRLTSFCVSVGAFVVPAGERGEGGAFVVEGRK